MADWKITLTRAVIVKGAQRAVQLDYVVEDMDRNLAIIEGVDKLLKQASQGETPLVPADALKWWGEVRASGNLQLYEILSGLETQWGLTFGSQEEGVVAEPSPQPQRNGHVPTEEVSDLDSMLTKHLKMLQQRNAILSSELERKQAEFDRNNADIMRISQMLAATARPISTPEAVRAETVSAPARQKAGRKPKEQPHAE